VSIARKKKCCLERQTTRNYKKEDVTRNKAAVAINKVIITRILKIHTFETDFCHSWKIQKES